MKKLSASDNNQVKNGKFGFREGGVIEYIKAAANLITIGVGIIIILIGFKYLIEIFTLIFDSLKDPGELPPVLAKWSEILGWASLTISTQEQTYPLSNILSLIVVGICLIALIFISFEMMKTGAKIVSWATNEQETTKRVLQDTVGYLIMEFSKRTKSDKSDDKEKAE